MSGKTNEQLLDDIRSSLEKKDAVIANMTADVELHRTECVRLDNQRRKLFVILRAMLQSDGSYGVYDADRLARARGQAEAIINEIEGSEA
jgi:hypothetical protein